MNHSQSALNLQQNIISKSIKNSHSDHWTEMINTHNLAPIIKEYSQKSRNRIYTPKQTLSMFLTQATSEDRSCQKAVNDTALNLLSSNQTACSISTGGYCNARQRLSKSMLKDMCQSVALSNEKKVNKKWQFRGRDIYLVDGTTMTMPDTIENQKKYPQPNFQKPGLGFPICRVVGIISLATGSLINAAVSPFSGKGAAEQALLRGMLGTFKKGDIILADALYSTYSLLSYVIEHGIDIVFVQNGARSRTTDFTKGKRLGKNDHLITIKRPKKKPEWMSQEEFDLKPKEITIRELKRGGKLLISTMLCPKKTSAKTVQGLYKHRWQIEVDFRNIKSTLGLKILSCKTPEMVLKEMWVYFLAYNMIRTLMLESALYNKMLPRQLSFKHTIQLLTSYSGVFYGKSYQGLLLLIGKRCIGNREGRVEPRAIKRRHNDYPLLMKLRHIAQNEIRQNGHPKKLK